MTWKVQQINTRTGAAVMEHSSGVFLPVTIPPEMSHPNQANAHLQSVCAEHEKSPEFLKSVAPQPSALQPQSSVVGLSLSIAALIPTLGLVAWYIWRALK
jgi:hypothetical protein